MTSVVGSNSSRGSLLFVIPKSLLNLGFGLELLGKLEDLLNLGIEKKPDYQREGGNGVSVYDSCTYPAHSHAPPGVAWSRSAAPVRGEPSRRCGGAGWR